MPLPQTQGKVLMIVRTASIDTSDNPPDPTQPSAEADLSAEKDLSVEEDLMERAIRLIRSGLEKRPL